MKQLLLTFGILATVFSGIFAQSMSFQHPVAEDSIIIVDLIPNQGTAEEGEFKIYFNLVNLTSDTLVVQADRLLNDMTTGHGSFFCWDLCYDSTGTSSVTPIEIKPNDTTNFGQYIIFRPNNKPGYSEVTMRFTNIANGEDFAEVTYRFSVGGVMDIEDLIDPKKALGSPYPNPASGSVSVNYELPPSARDMEISLFNLIGQKVKQTRLTSTFGTAKMDVQSLKSGIYFMYLKVDGRDITSRKVVISH